MNEKWDIYKQAEDQYNEAKRRGREAFDRSQAANIEAIAASRAYDLTVLQTLEAKEELKSALRSLAGSVDE